jgi:diacylglycerol kinase (ATP)
LPHYHFGQKRMPKHEHLLTNGKRLACIINPSAANKKWKRRKLLRKYIQENLPGQIIDCHKNKSTTIQSAKELSKDHDIIVAAGGDGTIADVIQGIIQSQNRENVALGIIPLGSGNAFSHSLGISRNVKKAIHHIKKGKIQKIDLFEVEGTWAAFGSIGASAQITQEKLKKNIPGFWGHIYAAKIMTKMPMKEREVELIDGVDDSGEHFKRKKMSLKALDCVVAKSKHFGYGWRAAPKAKLDDGYVDIVFFEMSGLKYILLFPLNFLGILQRTQKHFKAKKIIFRGKNLIMQYHGEIWGIKDQIEVNVIPQALKIIVPAK